MNMGNITFEQLPQAVSTLIERVEQLAGKVDEVLCKAAGKETGKRSLLSLEEVAALLGCCQPYWSDRTFLCSV